MAIDTIWPDAEFISGRNRLKMALSSLRAQLATSALPAETVFLGNSDSVALNPALFSTDVRAFETALRAARRTSDPAQRADALDAALSFYTDDLLLGNYENWIEPEQSRLRTLRDRAILERDTLSDGWQPLTKRSDARPPIPIPLTRFFGRSGEIARVVDLFSRPSASPTPLATLAGIGGIGKSRLAAECARRLTEPFDERVWFVELADKTEPEQIWGALRDALKLNKSADADLPTAVINGLSSAPALLVLDNMEQFVETGAASEFVNALRSRLPFLSCMTTSRHVLGAYGEQVFPVRSLLSRSEWASTLASPQDAAASVDLFADRARSAFPSFVLSHENLGDVLSVCQHLDGIPLAIELAAAQSNLLSPVQMLHQMHRRYAVLQSRRRDIPARHRSLRAVVQTSYDLLPPHLRRLFRLLSVFRGSFSISAAQQVCELGEDAAWDALNEMSDRSLIQPSVSTYTDRNDEFTDLLQPRFRILETLREFAEKELLESNGDEPDAQNRFWLFFDALSARCETEFLSGGGDAARAALDLLETDHDNLRAALDRSGDIGVTPENRLLMAARLHGFWMRRGYAQEGTRRLRNYLRDAPLAKNSVRGKAHSALGALAWATGSLETAQKEFTAGLKLYEADGDVIKVAAALNNIGVVAGQNGMLDAARHSYFRSLALYEQLGDANAQSKVRTNLGAVLISLGALDDARAILSDGLTVQRGAGDRFAVLQTLQSLSEIALRQKQFATATETLRESWLLRQELGEKSTLWEPLLTTVRLLINTNRPSEGIVFYGAAKQSMRMQGDCNEMSASSAELQEIEAMRLHEVVNHDALFQKGVAMPVNEVIALASETLTKFGCV